MVQDRTKSVDAKKTDAEAGANATVAKDLASARPMSGDAGVEAASIQRPPDPQSAGEEKISAGLAASAAMPVDRGGTWEQYKAWAAT